MPNAKTPKKPTHDVSVKLRDPEARGGTVGAAWLNDDGSVSIQLNPCVVLSAERVERLTLFPRETPKAVSFGRKNQACHSCGGVERHTRECPTVKFP